MSFITSPGVIVPPLTAGGVAYGTGSQAKVNSAGTAGQVLTSAGAGVPTWATASGGNFIALSTVNATGAASATISITGSYSSYLITGYAIGNDAAPTTTDLLISVFSANTFYNNSGTWAQTSSVLKKIGGSVGGSAFNLMFNGLTDTNSNTKIGSGTGYGYYSGLNCISVNKANSTGVSSVVFTLTGGVNFDNGIFKLYGLT